MKNTAASPLFPEPTHDEIALTAFLLWEKEGRQPGREMTYWFQAEAQLRALRQKKVEAVAESAKSWSDQSTAARSKAAATVAAPKPATKAKPAASKLTTTASRTTTVKPAPAAPSAAARPASRTSLQASR